MTETEEGYSYIGQIVVRPCQRGIILLDDNFQDIEEVLPEGRYLMVLKATRLDDPCAAAK